MAVSSFSSTAANKATQQYKSVFTTSGSWIKPAGVNKITVIACGGGAGSNGTSDYAYGANASYIETEYDISAKPAGAQVPIVIGAGGASSAAGGQTTVDNAIIAPGGNAINGATLNWSQPDAGVLSSSGDSYLMLQSSAASNAISSSNGYQDFYHGGYKFTVSSFYYSSDYFKTLTTRRPDGTTVSFTPASGSEIYGFSWYGSMGAQYTPNIASNGAGTIVIGGFYRPSSQGSQTNWGAIVTTDNGVTWSMLNQSSLFSMLTGSTTPANINYSYVNGQWIARLWYASSRETGTTIAASSDLSTWTAVGNGIFNSAAANNAGGVPYGGIVTGIPFFDSVANIWIVPRWSRSGYYQNRIFIHKSSGPSLTASTWTSMFYDQNENGGDRYEQHVHMQNSHLTVARLADGSYRHSMTYVNSSYYYLWEFDFNLNSTSSYASRTGSTLIASSSAQVFAMGFSKELDKFIYLTSSTGDGTYSWYSAGGTRTDAGFITLPAASYFYYYMSIGGFYDQAEKDHYMTRNDTNITIGLRKAFVSRGSKITPLWPGGAPGYNGHIRLVSRGTVAVYQIPETHPDKFCPPQYTDGTSIWAIYDHTWPGAGGYYMNSSVNGWPNTRKGNNGKVIIKWSE